VLGNCFKNKKAYHFPCWVTLDWIFSIYTAPRRFECHILDSKNEIRYHFLNYLKKCFFRFSTFHQMCPSKILTNVYVWPCDWGLVVVAANCQDDDDEETVFIFSLAHSV
jgi:hypothetical protein